MNLEEYKKLLSEFVSFRSVSTDPQYKPEIDKCVQRLVSLFKDNGFGVEVWRGEKSNPVVYADYSCKKAETILVYGHYDVQPASIDDGWKGDPFKLREEGGRLIARGVIDNKGQVLIHIFTVLKLIKEKRLKYNIKFLIEGDEETGAGELSDYVGKYKNKLRADHVLISDGEIVGNSPVIELSFRGGFNGTLQYATASTNVHSGIYGHAIANAAFELSKFVAGLYDEKNRVTVPGFYEGVDPITREQLANNDKLLKLTPNFLKSIGVKKVLTESEMDFYTQTGLRPAIEVTGFKSGYISEGYANIIPNTAEVRLNFRLVTSQDPNAVSDLFKKYVARVTPEYVDYKISVHGIHFPIKVDVTSDMTQHVKRLLRGTHGKEVVHRHVGGAIPVVFDFVNALKANTILVPLCNEDCNMHGVEENFEIEPLKKGLDFSERFFSDKKAGE